MGSAVIKPLTGWRGKVKANGELSENSGIWSVGVNPKDSCHPGVDCTGNCLADNVKDLPKSNTFKQAATKSRDMSHDGATTYSLKDLTIITPRISTVKSRSKKQTATASPANPRKDLSILNRFFTKTCQTSSQAAKRPPKCPTETASCKTISEHESQSTLEAPTERTSSRRTCDSPLAEAELTLSGNLAEVADNAPDVDINSTAALAVHTNGLSQDQIGNIRKQLYTEGFNPAEREGGVTFFIPVTEDGFHPQTDRTTVAERLTKRKRASLNYEERMMLANINRQAQLSKRKEFAVRDIRNVKVASSTTDISDRTKQDDDGNTDFDASALSAKNAGSDPNACSAKRAANDVDFEAWVIKKATNDAEFEASFIKKTTSDAEFEASVNKKANTDAEFEASLTKKVSSDAEFEASFTKKATNDAEFESSSMKKATTDAEFEASVAEKVTRVSLFDFPHTESSNSEAEYTMAFTVEEG